MENQTDKEFPKCPACGCTERFFESMVNELKEKKIAGERFYFVYDEQVGVVNDKEVFKQIPMGTELPGFGLRTDICTNCGCIYAIKLGRLKAEKKPNLLVPGNMPKNPANN